MKKSMPKLLVLLLSVALVMSLMIIPASAAPSISDIQAVPFKDGVMLTWTASSVGWTETYMSETELKADITFQELYDMGGRLNRPNNNSCYSSVFINAESTGLKTTFENTPGKTYYFYIMACDGANWSYAGNIKYTVPESPTLSVATNGADNTLTYTLFDNGNPGTIYRYDSAEKAAAGGNDYTWKQEVSYGGEPVVNTVNKAGTHYYILKQNIAGEVAPGGITSSQNGVQNLKVVADNNQMTMTFDHTEGAAWTILDIHTIDLDVSENAGNAYTTITKRLGKNVGDVSGVNAEIISDSITYTFDGTELVSDTTLQLMPGRTYIFQFTSHLPDEAAENQWKHSQVTYTVPLYQISEAVSTENTDFVTDTADFSVLAYALAAVVATGGSIVIKKRKI